MNSELRRSFKEKAKEKLSFGFRLGRPGSAEVTRTSSPDDLQVTQSVPSSVSGHEPETSVNRAAMLAECGSQDSKQEQDHKPMDGTSPKNNRDKRKSRHLTQPKGTITYEVSGSDTLASIAAQFDTTTSELKKTNKLMTSMVFPGQILYIPDKDYVASESSTPTSPTTPQEASSPTGGASDKPNSPPTSTPSSPKPTGKPAFETLKRLILVGKDWKLMSRNKGPGLAERQKSTESSGSIHLVPPSEDQVKQLDEECSERFIKVTVKHITDGQGVVSGILLVTPNAIMFDPNVSDPLVIERGAEEYGMIAPMDTVISAAMYHDIAAMNKHKRTDGEKPIEVYHDKTCALYKEHVSTPTEDNSVTETVSTPVVGITHSESLCSCGASERSLDIQSLSEPCSSTAQVVVADDGKAMVGFVTKTDTQESGAKPELGESPKHAAEREISDSLCSVEAINLSDISITSEEKVNQSVAVTSSSVDSGDVLMECSDVLSSEGGTDTTTEKQVKREPAGGTEGKCLGDASRAKVTVPASLGADMQIGNIQQGERSPETDRRGRSPPLHRDEMSVPRDSGGSPRPSSSPKDQGLLTRTLESLSSLGSSFPGSPNLTSLATGLFNWNQDGSPETNLAERSQDEGNDVFSDPEPTQEHSEAHNHSDGDQANSDHKTHIKMESVVKLSDKPDLFKDLNELVPRPATHYEDLPLYLCLRIGLPQNRRVSKTCPIESYMKHKQKPEYWFCIPRDKVDHLYAFFLRWSPSIYGSDDEITAKDRGFVVINGSDEDEDIDIIDDHFEKNSAKTRHMTKDWEIVNLEEARRRLTCAEVESLPLPELSEKSKILDEDHIRKLCLHLPARAEGYPWTLIYSSEKNGFSLKTLYRTMQKIDCPVLIIVKDTASHVFGAMLPCAIVMSDHFYGTGESFLFSFHEDFKRYGWSGVNSFFIKGNADSLSVGAGQGSFGLWLDGDLYHGRTQTCETYENDLLTEREDFVVQAVEAWGFI